MPPQTNTEEIIEKKATAPVATSCLIIAAVALLCAIALQLTEIAEYRSGALASDKDPGLAQAKKDVNKYKEEVGDILSKAPKTDGEGAPLKTGDGAAEAPAEDEPATDTQAGEAEPADDAADTKEAAEGAEPADTKAEEADAKEDAPATEEAAPEGETPAEEEKAGE